MNTGIGREEIERDYDRILFLAPTRRLADKTQVFPLEINDSVRNRLTHSHEVSNLARSIGTRLAYQHREIFGSALTQEHIQRAVPSLLAAIGLAHDLGNPPFGHQGEKAIQQWFKERDNSDSIHEDFKNFDGNCQTFRLLARLQILRDEFGLNLTSASLAALLKYPVLHNSKPHAFSKWGIFESERDAAKEIWKETGLAEGQRHPLAYAMEACDDIAYSVIDAEDTVKKGYASFYDLMDFLNHDGTDDRIDEVVEASLKKNAEFKKESLSSSELNDLSMQLFRVKAIAIMVEDATTTLVDKMAEILDGTINQDLELIFQSPSANLCKKLKDFDFRYGFTHPDVLKLELEGNNYIKETMDLVWEGIVQRTETSQTPFARYSYGRISENYRRVFESSDQQEYDKYQLLCDSISGMTESYLLSLHTELTELKNDPSRSK